MKLRITTLVIIENNQMENIYHSLEDNQDRALSGPCRPSK